MPAFLIRHGEQIPHGLPLALEKIRCPLGCGISYTIYSNDPISVHGAEKSVDAMRRMAAVKVERDHPNHSAKEFYWKGSEQGWCDSDAPEQRKKL
jgi:hypothetical protein